MASTAHPKIKELRELIAKKKKQRQAVLDEHFVDLEEFEESEAERHERIMDTPSAWQ